MGLNRAFSWEEQAFAEDGGSTWPPRSYSCNFCKKEFRSAQALGGHMNIHRRDRARLRQGISLGSSSNHHQQFPQSRVCNSDDFPYANLHTTSDFSKALSWVQFTSAPNGTHSLKTSYPPAAASSSSRSPPSTALSISLCSNPPLTNPSPLAHSEIFLSSDSSDSSELLEPSKPNKTMEFRVGSYFHDRSRSTITRLATDDEEEEVQEEPFLDLELRL
eukprot:TRINITY_DN4373_c0_g1_i1.p1 TRINITY_DN4373_c0_g1~~TRINITY_DN4373_c0_g1_i1.p1  ORF type:complete len:218 (-),score=41.46 TRINITY_DN4373_c0_g1_i1:453-1106(-)